MSHENMESWCGGRDDKGAEEADSEQTQHEPDGGKYKKCVQGTVSYTWLMGTVDFQNSDRAYEKRKGRLCCQLQRTGFINFPDSYVMAQVVHRTITSPFSEAFRFLP